VRALDYGWDSRERHAGERREATCSFAGPNTPSRCCTNPLRRQQLSATRPCGPGTYKPPSRLSRPPSAYPTAGRRPRGCRRRRWPTGVSDVTGTRGSKQGRESHPAGPGRRFVARPNEPCGCRTRSMLPTRGRGTARSTAEDPRQGTVHAKCSAARRTRGRPSVSDRPDWLCMECPLRGGVPEVETVRGRPKLSMAAFQRHLLDAVPDWNSPARLQRGRSGRGPVHRWRAPSPTLSVGRRGQ